MTTKRIETQLTIKAVDQYSGMLRNMRTVTGRFADGVRTEMSRLQDMRGPLKLIEDFKSAQQKAGDMARTLVAARERLRNAQNRLNSGGRITQSMRREYEAARSDVDRLTAAHERQRRKVGQLRRSLQEAGVNTSNLAGEQRRLAGALDGATTAFGRQMERMRRLETMQMRIVEARGRMDRSLATAANLSFVGNASMQSGRRILTTLSDVSGRAGDLEDQFAEFQNLTRIDDTRLVQLREELDGLRDVTKTSVSEMLDGLAVLVGKGMDFEDALAALPAAGRAAKATKTQFDEMGASGFALYDNLKIAPEELRKAFDIMAMGGKEGGFELSAMARKFPEITAGARALKMEGLDSVAQLTAALQIAMKSAGSEDQAATNLSNFLGKLTSPETVRRFAKMGVSIEDELRKAAENGVSPFEHMLGVIDDLTGGDALKMGELFGDKQVLDFLRAMIPNLKEYQRIKGAALSADGVVDADFVNALDTFNESKAQLGESLGKLFSLPPEVLESLTDLFQKADAIVERMIVWKKENPKLVKTLFLGATALGAMAVAGGALLTAAAGLIGTMAVLRFGLVVLGARASFASGEIASLVAGITRAGRSGSGLARIGTSLAAFTGGGAGAIRAVGGALRGVAGVTGLRIVATGLTALVGVVGTISAPVWVAIAAVVAAVGAAWKYWDRISSIVSGVASAIGERLQPVLESIKPVLEFLSPVIDGVKTAFSGIGNVIGEVVSAIRDFFSGDLFSREVLTDEEKARLETSAAEMTGKIIDGIASGISGLFRVGRDIIASLWNGVRAEFDAFIEWVKEIPSRIVEAVGSIDLSNIIDWPEPPRWWTYIFDRRAAAGTGATATPRPAGARAGGGPVRTGLPYLVNENTPRSEWFVPGPSGGILNVSQAQSAFRSYLSAAAPRPVGGNPELARLHRGAQGLRAASLAVLTSSALVAPAAAQGVASAVPKSNVRVEINGGINIQVPSGISDPDAIADLVSDRIGQRVAATMSASFSD